MPRVENLDDNRTDEVQDILSKTPSWMIRWGNTAISFILIGVLSLTYIIKYPDVINGQVVLTSKIPPERKIAKVSGAINEIKVENGEKVKQGELLAVLDNAAEYQSVFNLKDLLIQFKKSGYDSIERFENVPMGNLGEIATDYANFEKAMLQYDMNIKFDPFSKQFAANKISVEELRLRLENTIKQKEINQKSYQLLEKNLLRKEKLYEKGVISQQEFETDQVALLNKRQELQRFTISISQLKQNLSETMNNSSKAIIDSEMLDSQLKKDLIIATNQLLRRITEWELLYTLHANMAGTVAFLEVWNKNQNVEQGQNVFTIIPNGNSGYIARMKAPAKNSGRIVKDQKVHISLLGFPEDDYGVLNGQVEAVSPIPDESGFYVIDIGLKKPLITSYGQKIPFQYELSGNAEIITEDQRLIERIFNQFKTVFDRG